MHSFPTDPSPFNFNQWAAGLIDGGGHFRVRLGKYRFCIVASYENERDNLEALQAAFGGTIRHYFKKGGIPTKGIQLVITGRANVAVVLNVVNGYIQHPTRYQQFQACCATVSIAPKQLPLTVDSSWLGGFCDSGGHIRIEQKTGQARISIGQKAYEPLIAIQAIWGGAIHIPLKQASTWQSNDGNATPLTSYLLTHLRGKRKREQLQSVPPSEGTKINKGCTPGKGGPRLFFFQCCPPITDLPNTPPAVATDQKWATLRYSSFHVLAFSPLHKEGRTFSIARTS